MAGCPWVLNWENKLPREDRFTWRHNCVLSVIMSHLAKFLSQLSKLPPSRSSSSIHFVNAGSTIPPPQPRSNPGLLHKARDWRFDCDLPEWHNRGSKYLLPHKAVISGQCIDCFLISDSLKLILFIELTCPMEGNMDYWRSEKTSRYSSLSSHLNIGWSSHLFTIEVGAKGFVNNRSFFKTFGKLGFSARSSRQLLNDCSRESVRCSYIIWLNRFNKEMIMSRLSPFAPPPSLVFGRSQSPVLPLPPQLLSSHFPPSSAPYPSKRPRF